MLRIVMSLLLLIMATPAWASLDVHSHPQSAPCQVPKFNLQGSGNADITVSNTAGGHTVLAANIKRCTALITNSSSNDMRCATTDITVTSTAGYYVKASTTLELKAGEAMNAWKCIRTGGSDATASVLEMVSP